MPRGHYSNNDDTFSGIGIDSLSACQFIFCLTTPIIEARRAAKAIESAIPIQVFTARILGKNAIAQSSRQAQSKRRLLADATIALPPFLGKILVLPAGF
jgi:hypothetical protein